MLRAPDKFKQNKNNTTDAPNLIKIAGTDHIIIYRYRSAWKLRNYLSKMPKVDYLYILLRSNWE